MYIKITSFPICVQRQRRVTTKSSRPVVVHICQRRAGGRVYICTNHAATECHALPTRCSFDSRQGQETRKATFSALLCQNKLQALPKSILFVIDRYSFLFPNKNIV